MVFPACRAAMASLKRSAEEMSDSILKFYPLEPTRRFERAEIDRITELLQAENSSAMDAGSIKAEEFRGVQFIDCGSNLTRINCPRCGAEVDRSEWQQMMAADFSEQDGFAFNEMRQCSCGFNCSVHALGYKAHCGFGSACISVRVLSHFWNGWLNMFPWIGVVEARY